MSKSKFTMNALMVIVTAISAIGLFFTVAIYDMGEHYYRITEYEPIEGTEYSIRYSTKEPSGICLGVNYFAELMLEGNFGYDRGTTYSNGRLYLNEYSYTNTGVMLCDAVCVDTETFEKTVIMKNAMLRGRCASGELVCLADCLLLTNTPDVNSLCKLYGMTSSKIDPVSYRATVIFIDPESGEIVYSVTDYEALAGDFDEKWLSRTLEEVRQ